jgi:hypothetical protein
MSADAAASVVRGPGARASPTMALLAIRCRESPTLQRFATDEAEEALRAGAAPARPPVGPRSSDAEWLALLARAMRVQPPEGAAPPAGAAPAPLLAPPRASEDADPETARLQRAIMMSVLDGPDDLMA